MLRSDVKIRKVLPRSDVISRSVLLRSEGIGIAVPLQPAIASNAVMYKYGYSPLQLIYH